MEVQNVHPVPSERSGPAIMVCIIETDGLLRMADPIGHDWTRDLTQEGLHTFVTSPVSELDWKVPHSHNQ